MQRLIAQGWHRLPTKLRPVLVIVISVLISMALVANRPQLQPKAAAVVLPAVSVMPAAMKTVTLNVTAQGTVVPRTESNLIPEVNGKIIWLSPAFVAGGFISQGDPLIRIDQADYRDAESMAEAALIRAEVEEQLARSELARLQALFTKKLASQSQLDEAKRNAQVAKASLLDARTQLRQARRDLERTELLAPFTGRVRSESVDVGQFVSRGETIGRAYATDYVEIRLPIVDSQLAYLNIPLGAGGNLTEQQQAEVLVEGDYAGQRYQWRGKLVRTEAELDSSSRMLYGVVRVENTASADTPPLVVGMFVTATISGRQFDNIIELPRSSLRENNRLLLVDGNNQLRFRTVKVLGIERDRVLISDGLAAGERVCISALPYVVEGIEVEPVLSEAP